MPTQSIVEQTIPKLYKRNALNLLMFGYIRGVRSTLHTITVADAISMFMDDFGLTEDDFNKSSAWTQYNRMQNELISLKKTH